jgi:preprotein translocase subunit SecB
MLAKKSPLILKNFLLLRQTFQFIQPEEEVVISDVTDKYGIDIDFAINKPDDFYQCFLKIEINQADTPLPGYQIFIEGVGIFAIDNSFELSEEEKGNLIQYSSISICINSLRSIISNITSFAPFGKYILPSIDVNELLKDKVALQKQQKSAAKQAKKKIASPPSVAKPIHKAKH